MTTVLTEEWDIDKRRMQNKNLMKRVLFVCTGNTCRSPMAEAVFNDIAGKNGIACIAFSRGLFADGSAISDNAKTVLADRGIDASGHISKTVCKEDVESADYIVGITSRHAGKLISEFPGCADKIYAFPTDISDPFGQSTAVYKECLCEITDGIELIIKELFPDKENRK